MGTAATVLAAVSATAAVAGAGVSAYGMVQSGQAASDNAKFQSQVAANNALIAKQNADYTAKAGEEAATEQSLKGAAISGRIKGALAANAVDVNSGSALDVQETQKDTNQLDTETVMNNALLKAYGYRTQQTNFDASSGLLTSEAGQDTTGADLAAGGGLLSKVSSIPTKFNASSANTSGGITAGFGTTSTGSVGNVTNFNPSGSFAPGDI
jgi:hypothetical protein